MVNFGTNVRLMNYNTILGQAGMAIFGLIFNLYLASIGFREDYIGLFWFANTAALGASAIPAGYLSNRLGSRWCLAASSALMGLWMAIVTLVTSPVLMVVGGAVLGASTALLFVPGGPFLMDNCREEDRLRVFSLNTAAAGLAAVIGSLASGYLPVLFAAVQGLESPESARAYFPVLLVAAAICALGGIPMLLARPTPRRTFASAPAVPSVQPLSEPAARRILPRIVCAVAFMGMGTGLILPFYNVFLTERLGVSVEQVGVIYAVGSVLMIPFSLLGPVLEKRLGTIGTVVVPRLITVPFLLLPALLPMPATAALAYVVRAALMNATFPPDNAFTMALMPPRMRAVLAGMRSASWNSSWAIASLVAGQVIVAFGYTAVLVASAALHLAGALFYWAAVGPMRAKNPRSEAAVVPAVEAKPEVSQGT